MTKDAYECLKLENQICFPLYACSKEVVRRYRPVLDELDITYTQYITMMVLWEYGASSVSELGQRLFLDSGTLTPVLKSLEAKGYVTRQRSKEDERSVTIALTEEGKELRERAVKVPEAVRSCVSMDAEKLKVLYGLLYELLDQFKEGGKN